MNFINLAKDVAYDVTNNHSVTVGLYFKNGDEQTFYYYKPSGEITTRMFDTTVCKMNNDWCQSVSNNGIIEKITITCY